MFMRINPIIPLALVGLIGCGASTQDNCAQVTTVPEQAAQSEEESSDMMVVRVVVEVRPESREAFVSYLTDEAQTVRELDGCLRYELYADPADANRFLLYEEWATAAAFEEYQQSDLLRQSFATLGPMMAGPPDSSYFEAALRPANN